MPRGISLLDESMLQGRLWTPSLLCPALWLDAADISTISIATGVSQWRDKSENAKHASQSTTGNQPVYTPIGFNGLPVLTFNGSSSFLQNTTAGITSGTYSGAFNTFYVATRTTTLGGTILTDRASTLVMKLLFGIGRLISSDGLNSLSNNQISQTSYDKLFTSGGVISHTHLSGSRDNIWINGNQETVTSGTASNITGSAGFRIGSAEGSIGQYWSGVIGEILVTTSTVAAIERQKIEGYLAWKWRLASRLSASHPFYNRPPLIGD